MIFTKNYIYDNMFLKSNQRVNEKLHILNLY